MLFLARFILKGQSQAALVAASMAILGLMFPPAAWVSAAAVVLVTLVDGPQRGLITTSIALIGTAIFAYLIFTAPLVAVVFVLLVWLPAWLVATILRQTVSLALSLQALAAMCLVAVVALYTLFPDFGELWRQPLHEMVSQLAKQTDEFSLSELKQTEDWIIDFLPGLFASSIMFGTMLSLFLGRWWQAVSYNPGGFGKEFRGLDLGKMSALIATAVIVLAAISNSVFSVALVTVILVLYSVQALALLHAIIRIRALNGGWLFVVYLLMFFVPQVMLLLVLASIADPWLDFRKRLSKPAA